MDTKVIQTLDSRALLLLCNLYLNIDYPHCYTTQKEAAKLMKCSPATSAKILKDLVKKGLVSEVKSYVNFYFPVKNKEARNEVLMEMGLK